MSPYIGEIRLLSFPWVPAGWAACDGRALSAKQYPALASLIGQKFGGSGGSFNLPDLRGRTPLGAGDAFSSGWAGDTFSLGWAGGAEKVLPQTCPHGHALCAVGTPAAASSPAGNMLSAPQAGRMLYSSTEPAATNPAALEPSSVSIAGGGVPHDNMQPSLAVGFCIALEGEFPSASGRYQDGYLIGEIALFAFDVTPKGFLPCDGRVIPIGEYGPLFSILDKRYGGDGRNTFGLPDLQGRVPLGAGSGPGRTPRKLGEAPGVAACTLTPANCPAHAHGLLGIAGPGSETAGDGRFLAAAANYAPKTEGTVRLGAKSVEPSPSAPHDNMQPFLGLHFRIAADGPYPMRW